MIRIRYFAGALALIGVVAFIGSAFAKHQHHNGQQLIENKINTNGEHELHKAGEHTVKVKVANKKITGVTVTHRTKGNVAVKKYRTSKKMAQGSQFDVAIENAGSLIEPVAYQFAQAGIVYIGYAFSDGVDEYIYWFPAEMIVDPFTGAVEYVPVT
jgi:hypothetical protein